MESIGKINTITEEIKKLNAIKEGRRERNASNVSVGN
jgi:hypothetical protein